MFTPILSHASSDVLDQMGKKSYVWLEKDSLPIFAIPDNIKDLIKNDIAPKVLNQPLSPATYKDYFTALLYAEEFFYESCREQQFIKNQTRNRNQTGKRTFVAFDMASFPENPPFLGEGLGPCTTIGDKCRAISASHSIVCLQRAHQAVQNASDALFRNFIFPESVSRTNIPTAPALLCVKKSGSPPYLLLGQFWDEKTNFWLSRTGVVVSEAVHQLCQTSHGNRILVCAPSNLCCDGLMRSLLKWIPESDMFRVNTAFREKEEVPEDILPSCLYKETYTSLVLRRRNFVNSE
ncbi:hypothetical protein C1H46_005881 [Malus baccata]|uniref:Uncharacterized protein n=1 Tax=Malus baccata TaxID=106549 RepID=A0A540NC01_MALBA|nr:hypothetical protein C1H46_005881 [Malus baccata]